MGDISNVKNYTNYINNKLTTTNTYLSNIEGAITNGSSTITNTIASTHNDNNSNDNKNTNEIVTAINDNTNSINNLQTNDNSDLINAINNGFSNLNSNNNNNTNEIVSTINSASEDIIDGGNNNTNSIISNSNSNTNSIISSIEDITTTGGTGSITGDEFTQGVNSINDNNDYNTNRILGSNVTEEDSNIFDNVDAPEYEDPTPDLKIQLQDFANSITSSNVNSKTFTFNFRGSTHEVTLKYDILYEKLFRNNDVLYTLWQALWYFLIGSFIYRKCKRIYLELSAGEWDEIFTKLDMHDAIIDRSVK